MKENAKVFKKLTVLVVEDEADVLNDMIQMLLIFFKEVLQASNGEEALRVYETKKPDIILSDIQMPRSDGFWLADKIRAIDKNAPILLISSYSEKPLLIVAINMSVDGYILKPFDLEEVLQAITKSLRRSGVLEKNIICFKNGISYNDATKELSDNGLIIDLGPKEYALLSLFLRNQNRTLTQQEIFNELWPFDEVSDSALKGILHRLRKKIGDESIENVKTSGWRLLLDA
ncbi:MAG: response regulator transcription factor [Sulfuricurvum sp.]|nr:response regulator transcription factor [Sulfuricurvum sp.]